MKKSPVWLEFTKVNADGTILAICNHCTKSLTGKSKNGTSHLNRHLKKSCKKRPREDASTENKHKTHQCEDVRTDFQSSKSGDGRAETSHLPQYVENHRKKRPREDTSTENQSSINNDNRARTGEHLLEDASADFQSSTNFSGATAIFSGNTAVFVSWVQRRTINVDFKNQRLTLVTLFKLSVISIKAINAIKAIFNAKFSKRNVVEASEERSYMSLQWKCSSTETYWPELNLALPRLSPPRIPISSHDYFCTDLAPMERKECS